VESSREEPEKKGKLMPRVMVITDHAGPGSVPVLLDERVNSVHLSTDHAAMQFIERLGWAISDAEEAERVHARRAAARGSNVRRLASFALWPERLANTNKPSTTSNLTPKGVRDGKVRISALAPSTGDR
jgi:hypothetical protein